MPAPTRRTGAPRWLVIGLALIGVCLLVCVGTIVFGVTRFGGALQDAAAEFAATEVAIQIPLDGPQPGLYTLSEPELEQSLNQRVADGAQTNINTIDVDITAQRFEIRIDLNGALLSYFGTLTAAEGRVMVINADAEAPIVSQFFGAEEMAEVLEDAINSHFSENGLRITDVEMAENEIHLTAEPIMGATPTAATPATTGRTS